MPNVKVDGEPGRNIWDRMPNERAKTYQRFEVYRDLGVGRTLARVAQECGVSYATVQTNAIDFAWRDRVDAWDREMERVRVIAHREAISDMKKRQVNESKALQQKAIERLKTMKPSELKPRDVLSFIAEAAKIERMALGQPTEIVQSNSKTDLLGSLDLSQLNDAELASLEAIVAKAQSNGIPAALHEADDAEGEEP